MYVWKHKNNNIKKYGGNKVNGFFKIYFDMVFYNYILTKLDEKQH